MAERTPGASRAATCAECEPPESLVVSRCRPRVQLFWPPRQYRNQAALYCIDASRPIHSAHQHAITQTGPVSSSSAPDSRRKVLAHLCRDATASGVESGADEAAPLRDAAAQRRRVDAHWRDAAACSGARSSSSTGNTTCWWQRSRNRCAGWRGAWTGALLKLHVAGLFGVPRARGGVETQAHWYMHQGS